MSNTLPAASGDGLKAWKLARQKAIDEATARRKAEAEDVRRNHRIKTLFAPALDHANAIAGGEAPASPNDAANFLINLRQGLAEENRLGWLDAMEELDPTPLRRFALGAIREALPTARGGVAKGIKAELTDPQLCWEFWAELMSIGGVFWNWLQENVPEDGPPTHEIQIELPQECPRDAPSTQTVRDPTVAWTKPDTVANWSRVYGISRNTMSQRFKKQIYRNRLVGRLYEVVVDDLPAIEQSKHRPATA